MIRSTVSLVKTSYLSFLSLVIPAGVTKHLDELIRSDLQGLRNSYFRWLLIFTGIVVIGIVVEELVERVPLKKQRFDFNRGIVIPRHRLIRWLGYGSSVGLILVIIGLAGEGCFEGLLSWTDGLIEKFDAIELEAVETHVGDAKTSARIAEDAAAHATDSARNSESIAHSARKEADSFEKDIVSAKEQAATAESHLTEALQRSAAATAELERIKTPRSLTNVQQLVLTLQQFSGTEYTFSAVCPDEECFALLKSVEDVLHRAGWNRGKQVGGFPAINVFGKDAGYSVPVALTSGVRIFVEYPEGLEGLRPLPVDQLPSYLKSGDVTEFFDRH